MMYTAFKHAHTLFAVFTLLLSIASWAWPGKPRQRASPRWSYVLTRIFGGIAALTGLVVTFVGPGSTCCIPTSA